MQRYRSCQLEGQAACSSQLQPVLFFQVALRGAAEITGMQCLALLALIISNIAPYCVVCLTPSHSISVQLSQEYGKVVAREHSWKCRFLFIYYSPMIVKWPTILVLHILFSQKMAKTETYDKNPRLRILLQRYSYEEFCC